MEKITILGVRITNRAEKSLAVQNVLTMYGCTIRTRLGLHDVLEGNCSHTGLILLELTGEEEEMIRLENALRAISGVEVQKMVFA